MNGTIIVAESWANIPANIATIYDINILPMHISMNGESFDDGNDFPVQRIFEHDGPEAFGMIGIAKE